MTILARESSNQEILRELSNEINIFRFNGEIDSLIDCFLINKFDLIIHLASFFRVEHQSSEIGNILDSNLLLATQILEAMAKSKINRIINTSTSWQYLHSEKYCPTNLYSASKEAFEKIMDYYIEMFKLKVINLYLYDTFGENDTRSKILNLLKHAKLNESKLNITSGQQSLDLVHIEDLVEAYLIAIELLTIENKIQKKESYGVFTQSPIKLIDIINQFGLNGFVNVGSRPHRDREVMYPSYPFQKLPSWYPKRSIFERLESFFDI